ncbi:mechanosensitive ion channel family protein [Pradoshia eiseniae]|uniref:mechanosensitive ion channel family protein n=1 Tax=Pradoshia eiseniae TaxID=2064768 RepID=UPI0026AF80A9
MIKWSIFLETDFWIDLGISVGVFLLFLIFRKLFAKYIFSLLLRVAKKTPTELLTNIFIAFEKPIRWAFLFVGVYVSAKYFPHFNEKNEFFKHIMEASVIIFLGWGLYNLSATSSAFFTRMKGRYKLDADDVLVPFFSKSLRFIIVALGFSMVASVFGYNVGGFVAGLGLGGVAIAFAAKDALAHLLGGFVIITEKPFKIGDWILTPEVEGTVEDISFRSTKIRTFAQAVVTMPNATLANGPITNWSQMGKRQISYNFTVPPDTSKDKLQRIVSEIEMYLKTNDEVHPETILVKFDHFNELGYSIMVYLFTKTTVWSDYLQVKEELNLKIVELLEREGTTIALPSSRVYVDQDSELVRSHE